MHYKEAILLGFLQGLTEFLPVSSTAHMDIVPQLVGWKDPGAAFSAIAQLGPIVAIIAYFREDLGKYWKGIVRTKRPGSVPKDDIDARLGWYTLLGSIPIVIFGAALNKLVEHKFREMNIVGIALILLAIIMWIAETTAKNRVSLENMNLKQSQVIGWAQVLALVPGTSRSGVTITAGLFQGLDRESAARFSFLLSIPAITAAGLYELAKNHHFKGDAGHGLVAALVAGIVAYVVIRWFLGYMKEHSTGIFIGYRILLGCFVLYAVHAHIINRNAPVKDEGKLKAKTAVVAPEKTLETGGY